MTFASPLSDEVCVPQYLFKYRPLRDANGNPHKRTESIFRDRQLWFAEPASFNDPFDCNLQLTLEGSDEEAMAFFNTLGLRQNLPAPKLRESWIEASKQVRDVIYNKSSVFCWAGRGDSIPMFAYYGDGHCGIALQFQIKYHHPLGQADAVMYEPKLPPLNYPELRASRTVTQSLIFTKAKCWEHEEELRVFRHNEPPGNVGFEPHHLRRVIFGAKCSDDDVQLVRGWISGWPSSVILAKATPASDSFSLCINDFETFTG